MKSQLLSMAFKAFHSLVELDCQSPPSSAFAFCPWFLRWFLALAVSASGNTTILWLESLHLSLYLAGSYPVFGGLLNYPRPCGVLRAWTDFVQIPALPQTSPVTLGKALHLPGLGPFLCKLRLITTALQGCYEDSWTKYGAFQFITVVAALFLRRTLPSLSSLWPPCPMKLSAAPSVFHKLFLLRVCVAFKWLLTPSRGGSPPALCLKSQVPWLHTPVLFPAWLFSMVSTNCRASANYSRECELPREIPVSPLPILRTRTASSIHGGSVSTCWLHE